jgi:hypothetical protein
MPATANGEHFNSRLDHTVKPDGIGSRRADIGVVRHGFARSDRLPFITEHSSAEFQHWIPERVLSAEITINLHLTPTERNGKIAG